MRPRNRTVTQGHCTLHVTQARVAQGAQDSPGQKTELLNSPHFSSCIFHLLLEVATRLY